MTVSPEHPFDLNDPCVVACYDELPLWSALFGALLLRHIPLRPGCVALDIGCGTGFPLLELAQRLGPASHVYGVDPWVAAVDRARYKARLWGIENITLIRADAAQLPLPDASVDLIVSNLGVNNFANRGAVLAECRRVARPCATLALTTNLQGHMAELYAVVEAVLRERGAGAPLSRLQAHVAHRATVDGVAAELAAAQFVVRRVVEDAAELRFADGSALLRHAFIRLAFRPAWEEVLAGPDQPELLAQIEAQLNALAAAAGELRLTIPMAYVEAQAAG